MPMVATIMAVMLIAYGIVNLVKGEERKEGDEGRQRKRIMVCLAVQEGARKG